MITNDVRCKCGIKSRLSWQKQHSTRRPFFTRKLDLHLRKKLRRAIFGADEKYLASSEMWCRRMMEII
jgi:hypothetical protein